MPRYTDFDRKLTALGPVTSNDRVHFFKYMSAQTAKIVIANQTLRWSTPGHLNDPYDMQFDFDLAIDQEYVASRSLNNLWEVYSGQVAAGESWLSQTINKIRTTTNFSRDDFDRKFGEAVRASIARVVALWPKLNEELKQSLLTGKVLCLSDRPDTASMWNHYSDSHKGVVLRFRTIPAFDSPYATALPVDYVEAVPQLHERDELVNFFSGISRFDRRRILNSLVYTKGVGWASEREWRCFSGDGRNKTTEPEDIRFNKHELDGLIFGRLCPDEDRRALTELAARYPNLELLQARAEGGFALVIETLTATA